jgi:glycine/D-amino acid oxidase-like deaminating enzyme
MVLPHSSIAVIGGGFAGLATSNFIINSLPNCVITLFDLEKSPGINGASAAAGGLMHPFTPKGKLIWKGIESFNLAEQLIQSCQPYSPNQLISKSLSILRPCFNDNDFLQWKETAKTYPDVSLNQSNRRYM